MVISPIGTTKRIRKVNNKQNKLIEKSIKWDSTLEQGKLK